MAENFHSKSVSVELFSEAMQAYGRADMDCMKYVNLTGCHVVIDLGGTCTYNKYIIHFTSLQIYTYTAI